MPGKSGNGRDLKQPNLSAFLSGLCTTG